MSEDWTITKEILRGSVKSLEVLIVGLTTEAIHRKTNFSYKTWLISYNLDCTNGQRKDFGNNESASVML